MQKTFVVEHLFGTAFKTKNSKKLLKTFFLVKPSEVVPRRCFAKYHLSKKQHRLSDASFCTDSFYCTRKRDAKVKRVREGIVNLKKIASCKKSRKLLHTLQKANMRAFYAKHKSVYLSFTCGKQSNLSKGTRYLAEHLAFANPF